MKKFSEEYEEALAVTKSYREKRLSRQAMSGDEMPEETVIICASGTSGLRAKLDAAGLSKEKFIKKPLGKWDEIVQKDHKAWLFLLNMVKKAVDADFIHMSEEAASMALASRLFGGCVLDEEWGNAVSQVLLVSGSLLLPNVVFESAIKKEREVLIHHSIKEKFPWAMDILALAGRRNTESRWAFRTERSSVRKDADAFVLCAREKDMEHALKKKNKYAKKLKAARAAYRAAVDDDVKKRTKKKVKKCVLQAKFHRGNPVSLAAFARQIEQVV